MFHLDFDLDLFIFLLLTPPCRYLLRTAGLRTVPVEIGSSYTNTAWTQRLLTLDAYIHDYVLNEKS